LLRIPIQIWGNEQMNTKNIVGIPLLISSLILLSFLLAIPAWSAPGGKKLDLKDSSEKSVLDRDDKKIEGKGKSKAKKKVLKKAGTAAAVGVTTKKVSSGLKGTAGLKDVVKDAVE